MRRDRAIVLAAGLFVMLAGSLILLVAGPSGGGWFPGCLFHRLTGLHCPGCGMTRAVHAMLHGDVSAAFRLNPLGMTVLPLGLAWLGIQLPSWLRGSDLKWPLAGRWLVRGIIGVLLFYWISRNIPVWPFSLLAPG